MKVYLEIPDGAYCWDDFVCCPLKAVRAATDFCQFRHKDLVHESGTGKVIKPEWCPNYQETTKC